MEAASDLLRQLLDSTFIPFAQIFVPEPREQVLLMQLIQFRGLLCNIGQEFGNLLLYVNPARREQVHFNHHVAIFFETARLGDQAAAFLRLRCVEAIGRTAKAWLFGGVVCEGLAVGDIANKQAQAISIFFPICDFEGRA